jgi:asparagine synthase (glutamine-hydrolysing)
MFHTTPESLRETQPHRDESGSLALTMDGRVDNRAELRAWLEAKGAVLRQETDAELVLRSYEVWGEECPARIVGDFAFAIWDARRRSLFLARDFIGIKPLYYATCGKRFVFASALPPLLLAPGFQRLPNERMIAEYLSCRMASLSETFFQEVFRLTPAHRMTVTAAGPSQPVRYWSAADVPEVRERNDADVEARFLDVFRSAIGARMRCQASAGAELSGGVDSSSVVSLMHRLPAEHQHPPFETFSQVYPGLPCDETEFIRLVLDKTGARGNLIPQSDIHPESFAEQARAYADVPDTPNMTATYPVLERARDKGIRVLLTGFGGDDWFSGSALYYADLLRQMRLLRLFQYLRQDARAEAFDSPYRKLYACGIRPLLPNPLVQKLRRWLRKDTASPYPWIADDLVARSRLREKHVPSWTAPSGKGFAHDDLRRVSLHADRGYGLEMIDRCTSRYGIEYRHPFHDRRMVEFSLSLPEAQRRAPGLSKRVLRRAMRDLLPGTIADRRTKADFSHHYGRALEALGGTALFKTLAVEQLGWVQGPVVRSMAEDLLASYRSGTNGYVSLTWKVWRVLAVELWFRYSFLNTSGCREGDSGALLPRCENLEESDHVAAR